MPRPRPSCPVGERFGHLIVLADKPGTRYWLVKCECGKEYDVHYAAVIRGTIRSCGCGPRRGRRLICPVGKKFGLWTVIGEGEEFKHRKWICRCECGTERLIYNQAILTKASLSCGCVTKAKLQQRHDFNTKATFGERYGNLVVTGVSGEKKQKALVYKFACDCGNSYEGTIAPIRQGLVKSCGCWRSRKHPQGEAGYRKLLDRYKKNAASRNRNGRICEWRLDEETFRRLVTGQCHYCGSSKGCTIKVTTEWSEFRYTGIDRVNSSGDYDIENCVPCCKTCNVMKMSMGYYEFLSHIKRIAEHHTSA